MDEFYLARAGNTALRPIPIEPGLSLAQNLFLAGAWPDLPLCSGLGHCGLCRARYLENPPPPLPKDRAMLSQIQLDKGFRLSCQRGPLPGEMIQTPGGKARPARPDSARIEPRAVLGVDLGTTSWQWRLTLGLATLAEGGGPNPQMGGGAEVMSRLSLAQRPRGATRLREVVITRLEEIISSLPVRPGLMCLAGNPAMVFLALGLDSSGLASAPYRLDHQGNQTLDLGPGLPLAHVPPLWAPFVGADISAGFAALVMGTNPPAWPFILADLGTNGEFVLAVSPGEIYVASVPMGPALEGVGMIQGRLAGPGVATAFQAMPNGLAPVLYGEKYPGGTPRGVSGTGYISLLAKLITLGVMEKTGQFASRASCPLAGKILAGLDRSQGQSRLNLAGISLWPEDVETMLKVKAAFNVALGMLLQAGGLDFAALREFYLAGALGEHAALDDLETLGFLPPGGRTRTKVAGNTSLNGACLLGQNPAARDWLSGVGGGVRLVEVVNDANFQSRYVQAMRFEYVRGEIGK